MHLNSQKTIHGSCILFEETNVPEYRRHLLAKEVLSLSLSALSLSL
jgi:hypothetical protein